MRIFPIFPLQMNQLPGFLGSLLVIFGTFQKMFSIPLFGNIAYWNHGSIDGKIMLSCGVLALLFVVLKQIKYTWFLGAIALGCIVYTFYRTYAEAMRYKSMFDSMGGKPSFSSGISAPGIDFGLGLLFILLGIILLFISSAMRMYLSPRVKFT